MHQLETLAQVSVDVIGWVTVQTRTLAFFFLHLSQATAISVLRRLPAGADGGLVAGGAGGEPAGGLVAGGEPPGRDEREAWLIVTDLLPTWRLSHGSSSQ